MYNNIIVIPCILNKYSYKITITILSKIINQIQSSMVTKKSQKNFYPYLIKLSPFNKINS